MTQKLKISIKEMVEIEEEISAELASEIQYDEYILGNLEWHPDYVPKSMKRFNGTYCCKFKKLSQPRPATDEEIKAYHRREHNKYCPHGETDFEVLDEKEVVLEVIDE